MALTFVPPAARDIHAALDTELDLVESFVKMVMEANSLSDRIAITNFYVALKSKPMIILAGDAQSDTTGLVRVLTRVLLGDNRFQGQILMGHPWWVGVHSANGVLTSIHTRFVTDKIVAIIEEASQPENSSRMYFACLSQISPVELSSCFVEVAFQLSHGEIMRIGDVHFSKPMPYPGNMWLLGTIDESRLIPVDENLMSEAMIVKPPTVEMISFATQSGNNWKGRQATFLRSCIRNRQSAYRKLQSILPEHGTALAPLLNVVQCLKSHNLSLLTSVLDHCVIYLANAWSFRGQGLFDPITCRNLEIASDLVIKQILLPGIESQIRSSQSLRLELQGLLRTFPHSLEFLEP